MKRHLSLILISLITLLGLTLRTVNLNASPPGFNADEAALGYNAYSLLKTGKDEWGQTLPLVFRSFDDYKPGLYVYLDVPFVAIMGLNELAVRMPSILLGTLSILIIYLLSKRIFKNDVIALSTAFLLSVSPWSSHYSRGAWETNVATFFILLGVYTFLKSQERFKYYYVSATAFILSMYTYQSTRLVVPLLILGLIIFYWKKVFTKKIIGPVIFSGIIILPLLFVLFSNQGLARFQGVSIFTDLGIVNKINRERGEHQSPSDSLAKVFHNQPFYYALYFTENYFNHFSPSFLFTRGDALGRNKIPEMGQLYLFEIATLLIGVFMLIIKKYHDTKVIWLWLIVAPIAAALTFQAPHALRAQNMVMPLALISGLGLGAILNWIWDLRKWFKLPLTFLVGLVIFFFVLRFLHQYFVHLPKTYALEWQNGFSQLVNYVNENEGKYNKVVITDRYDQPYILWLFYTQTDPKLYQSYQKSLGKSQYGFLSLNGFDKYEFRESSVEEYSNNPNTLFVTSKEVSSGNILKQIKFPNGDVGFSVIGEKK